MIIKIRGAKNRQLVKWLKLAAQFYCDQLMKEDISKYLILNIKIQPNTTRFTYKADCMWDDFTPPPDPTEFNIRLSKEKDGNEHFYFKSLAHEMVHVKQFATNQLDGIYGKGNTHKWKGPSFDIPSKKYPKQQKKLGYDTKVVLDDNDGDYYFQPWEVEAYGLEVGLIAYFLEEYGEDTIPFGKNTHDWD
jgi:hypothetical protein|tara:strand:+ start:1730 stop:2299 length:570 start_codon:yes stop_codon:yes gene_type:complete